MIKMQRYNEKIYGNLATVYHRTSFTNLIDAVYTSGFKPGEGDMYGVGFYSTYELKSQERNSMTQTYGDIVVKFSVAIENFFIFDYSEFIKSPNYRHLKSTKETFIDDQIKYFNIGVEKEVRSYDNKFSSTLALHLYRYSDLAYKVQGIIFTGERDGKVLVAYETGLIVPLSYRTDGMKSFEKVDTNKEYFKKALKRKIDTSKMEIKGFSWFTNATKSNFSFETDNYNHITWLKGTWEDGIWEEGTWKDGTWKDGTWLHGLWKNGTWENGVWISGRWKKGLWKDGLWKDGLWTKGTWEGGIWEDGLWKDGTWKDGLWKRGTWKGGEIYSNKFSCQIKSKVNPNIFKELESKAKNIEELKERLR